MPNYTKPSIVVFRRVDVPMCTDACFIWTQRRRADEPDDGSQRVACRCV